MSWLGARLAEHSTWRGWAVMLALAHLGDALHWPHWHWALESLGGSLAFLLTDRTFADTRRLIAALILATVADDLGRTTKGPVMSDTTSPLPPASPPDLSNFEIEANLAIERNAAEIVKNFVQQKLGTALGDDAAALVPDLVNLAAAPNLKASFPVLRDVIQGLLDLVNKHTAALAQATQGRVSPILALVGTAAAALILAACTAAQLATAGSDVAAFQSKAAALCQTIESDAAIAATTPAAPIVALYVTPYLGTACTAESLAGGVTAETIAWLQSVDANLVKTVAAAPAKGA
jgi:hypothetical protein